MAVMKSIPQTDTTITPFQDHNLVKLEITLLPPLAGELAALFAVRMKINELNAEIDSPFKVYEIPPDFPESTTGQIVGVVIYTTTDKEDKVHAQQESRFRQHLKEQGAKASEQLQQLVQDLNLKQLEGGEA